MYTSDHLSDLLTRIRNANIIGSEMVILPKTNLAVSVLSLLKREGFIDGFDIFKNNLSNFNFVQDKEFVSVKLKFKKGSILKPYISCIKRVSKPGLRVYSRVSNLPVVFGGIGVAILSTSKGLMTSKDAKVYNVGGEVLFYIW
uniref:Small ribosomal subunit protein uS8c n=1 Tax=Lepocinclis tripteris TaxID=135494 RepID=A0A3G3LL38_9EUGL|nr:ribosomal protein S8 [Lepocinclis tripteris]